MDNVKKDTLHGVGVGFWQIAQWFATAVCRTRPFSQH